MTHVFLIKKDRHCGFSLLIHKALSTTNALSCLRFVCQPNVGFSVCVCVCVCVCVRTHTHTRRLSVCVCTRVICFIFSVPNFKLCILNIMSFLFSILITNDNCDFIIN